jgi:hypothetical protein
MSEKEEETMRSIGILGGSKLGEGPWRPGPKVWSFSFLGGCEIDFRQAELEEDVTKLTTVSILGGTKVIVPPDLPVTLSGFSLLGGREVKRPKAREAPPASAKSLHINAIAILGGLSVTEKAD